MCNGRISLKAFKTVKTTHRDRRPQRTTDSVSALWTMLPLNSHLSSLLSTLHPPSSSRVARARRVACARHALSIARSRRVRRWVLHSSLPAALGVFCGDDFVASLRETRLGVASQALPLPASRSRLLGAAAAGALVRGAERTDSVSSSHRRARAAAASPLLHLPAVGGPQARRACIFTSSRCT